MSIGLHPSLAVVFLAQGKSFSPDLGICDPVILIVLLGLSWSTQASLHSWSMHIPHLLPALWQRTASLGRLLEVSSLYLESKVSLPAMLPYCDKT